MLTKDIITGTIIIGTTVGTTMKMNLEIPYPLIQLMIVINPMALVITIILKRMPGYVSPSIISSSMHEKDDNSGKMLFWG
jgi:uncharacterized protein (DUF983 family)